jgi:hypothetical protein
MQHIIKFKKSILLSFVSIILIFIFSGNAEDVDRQCTDKEVVIADNGPVPAASQLKTDRPRLLLRPGTTPFAVSFDQLRTLPLDGEYPQLLEQLRKQRDVSAQAMVWLLTGEKAFADSAIAIMLRYRVPKNYDTFHIHSRLTEFGYAYDWLYNYEGFTPGIKTEIRRNVLPLARQGLRNTNDHIFHNYVWMSGGGSFIWALATAGEDEDATALFEGLRARFNNGLFPAWIYLDGLPSEPLGYWTYYVFDPGALVLLASQSASETDILGTIRKNGDWFGRQYENLIQSVLPDLRFIPWGDLQSGPNGGITREEAGIIDALAWALNSPNGVWLSRNLAKKRGIGRFNGETAIYYMLYSRLLKTAPSQPPMSFLAGNKLSGHFIARSDWGDNSTVVSLGCQDHFGDHHHYDQGGFMIYHNGLLAVDPPIYNKVAGPQQPTSVHNTLLVGGKSQRRCRGQWFTTLAEFEENRTGGPRLETGDILFYKDTGNWTATACQFAQAYSTDTVASCVRQLLFIRPGTVVVVDNMEAPAGSSLPQVEWLLQLPQTPRIEGNTVTGDNGKSWLRCTPLCSQMEVTVRPTEVNTHRVSYRYEGAPSLHLVHLIETGDNGNVSPDMKVKVREKKEALEVSLGEKTFVFRTYPPFEIRMK